MATAEPSTPFTVNGKTAIITGAGSGINLAFAKLLLSKHCNVVIADLALRPEAEALVDEYGSASPGKPRAMYVETNVVLWKDLEQLFVTAEETFGQVDIVCPGAGIFEPHWSNLYHPPGSKESKDSVSGGPDGVGHYALLDINMVHPIRTTQLAMFRWLNPANGKGRVASTNPKRIVHISSIAGQVPSFPAPMYAASKAGLSAFIRSLAQLDDIGIRVNGVAPGIIRTPLWLEHPEKMFMLDQEQDAWVEADEVAGAMLRCVEDDSIVGGTVLEVLKDSTRAVDWRMDPGPVGRAGATTSNASLARAQVFEWLKGSATSAGT